MFLRPSHLSAEEKQAVLERFWKKDPTLWAADPDEQKAVSHRLGWLDVASKMRASVGEMTAFAEEVKGRGFRRVVLFGMGGSSLCPLVLQRIFGTREGYPTLDVLDTTDPDEIARIENEDDWGSTLFVVASKSGTTMEPNAQFAYFWALIKDKLPKPGDHFVAITDPGTPLQALAAEHGFWRVFENPTDLGGRYSALSYFGLVPAALHGVDIAKLLDRAEAVMAKCGPEVPWAENPACLLGEFMAEYGVQSRDKLSILADSAIQPLGLWLEQLLAESTGKQTRGIVPIVGETPGIPGFYGGERIFAYLRFKETREEDSFSAFVSELRQAEFPVHEIWLEDLYDLGGQFFLWEMATALASHFLDVNAFDEPDVTLAKEKAKEVLKQYQAQGKMPVQFWVDPGSQLQFRPSDLLASSMKGLSRCLRDMFQVLPNWGYMAFLPYLPYDAEIEQMMAEMRHLVRQEKGCGTTLGYGPRYLHSTGQIHKGGPFSAAYLIFTRRKARDYPEVPALGASFWHLQFAQAVGDFEALSELRRRVIHVHLPEDYRLGMQSFTKVLSRAVRL